MGFTKNSSVVRGPVNDRLGKFERGCQNSSRSRLGFQAAPRRGPQQQGLSLALLSAQTHLIAAAAFACISHL